MDSISNVIEDCKKEKGTNRVKYTPYSLNIAKHVWGEIATNLINNLKYDEFSKVIWSELIKYIHGDESCLYDINKSIALVGRTGSGKTKTMEIMSKYMNIDEVKYIRNAKLISFNYKIISSREMVNEYAVNGFDAIQKYIMMSNICIDDIGSETSSAKYYGTELNVIEEIIEMRYSKGLITHFTSNCNIDEILEIYGSRVHSRIIQTCNLITLNGEDYRLN